MRLLQGAPNAYVVVKHSASLEAANHVYRISISNKLVSDAIAKAIHVG